MSARLLCVSCGGDLEHRYFRGYTSILECTVCHTMNAARINKEDGTVAEVTADVDGKDLAPARKALLEKLRNLEIQQKEVKAIKKSQVKDYNDQLKDLEAEIDEVLLDLEDKA